MGFLGTVWLNGADNRESQRAKAPVWGVKHENYPEQLLQKSLPESQSYSAGIWPNNNIDLQIKAEAIDWLRSRGPFFKDTMARHSQG